MMELPFHTLDVFTDRVFGGNPLAVFPDATHLPTDLMQRIAREMNLSETVFLGPPETGDATARVRIFTPAVEVPFAGHPTIGAAVFLAGRREHDQDAGSDRVTLRLEENVGPIPVEVRYEGERPVFARFTTAVLPEHRPCPHALAELASLVGLEPTDIGTDGLEPEMVSCGLPFVVIPVRKLDAVRRAALDMERWSRTLSASWAPHLYLVSTEAEGEGVDLHVRMFAPGAGVAEDPATGSAAAALAGYLSAADGRPDGSLSWTLEQGLEVGRPSLLYAEADRTGGRTVAVRVGGHAVAVTRGAMVIPD
ncbi:MAG TPA: PhzF family phenazine biosynthesis protein [Longimicrobiales bacterium]|nr:PhzF family phenazine biosynthesis protein [Longimicrobiales bacterium]